MTYIAILTVCGMLSNQCVILRDTRGPYSTKAACEIRLKEMNNNARKILTKSAPNEKWRARPVCKKSKGQSI